MEKEKTKQEQKTADSQKENQVERPEHNKTAKKRGKGLVSFGSLCMLLLGSGLIWLYLGPATCLLYTNFLLCLVVCFIKQTNNHAKKRGVLSFVSDLFSSLPTVVILTGIMLLALTVYHDNSWKENYLEEDMSAVLWQLPKDIAYKGGQASVKLHVHDSIMCVDTEEALANFTIITEEGLAFQGDGIAAFVQTVSEKPSKRINTGAGLMVMRNGTRFEHFGYFLTLADTLVYYVGQDLQKSYYVAHLKRAGNFQRLAIGATEKVLTLYFNDEVIDVFPFDELNTCVKTYTLLAAEGNGYFCFAGITGGKLAPWNIRVQKGLEQFVEKVVAKQ